MADDDEGTLHEIGQGDSISQLMLQKDLFWQAVCNHPWNSKLKELRKDSNTLFQQNVVFVPAKPMREESADAEARHVFGRKGVPKTINPRFIDLGQRPLAGKSSVLVIDGKEVKKGKLDSDDRLGAWRYGHGNSVTAELKAAGE